MVAARLAIHLIEVTFFVATIDSESVACAKVLTMFFACGCCLPSGGSL